jgi:hypothetical protein
MSPGRIFVIRRSCIVPLIRGRKFRASNIKVVVSMGEVA